MISEHITTLFRSVWQSLRACQMIASMLFQPHCSHDSKQGQSWSCDFVPLGWQRQSAAEAHLRHSDLQGCCPQPWPLLRLLKLALLMCPMLQVLSLQASIFMHEASHSKARLAANKEVALCNAISIHTIAVDHCTALSQVWSS